MKCRFCGQELTHEFIDLGFAPPSNSYLTKAQLQEPEVYYPLKVWVCDSCFLVQIDEVKNCEEIFSKDYKYFSSYSSSWLKHCKDYADMITEKLKLDSNSLVTEIASNDGYLLQYFVEKGIPCVGIEPSGDTADVAISKGINTYKEFFTENFAWQIQSSDLIIGNNVLAHVPNINDFVAGLKVALKEGGTITMEFPHILNLIKYNQFDTIYHEHYSYLSLFTVNRIFRQHGLVIYDVDELSTHGGSLRIYATHSIHAFQITDNVFNLLIKEQEYDLDKLEGYIYFKDRVLDIKHHTIEFFQGCREFDSDIVAYGAAAKGNTFLNYCCIKKDSIQFVVDKSPYKQGLYLPGSHIPIVDIEKLKELQPEYIIIFPWNLQDEIIKELSFVEEWGGQFVTFIPELEFN